MSVLPSVRLSVRRWECSTASARPFTPDNSDGTAHLAPSVSDEHAPVATAPSSGVAHLQQQFRPFISPTQLANGFTRLRLINLKLHPSLLLSFCLLWSTTRCLPAFPSVCVSVCSCYSFSVSFWFYRSVFVCLCLCFSLCILLSYSVSSAHDLERTP